MKQLPLGTSDYREIVSEGYSYVDKTLLIQEILESGAKVSLIPRPRRFGKTTNLSMLYYFFTNAEGDNTHLFKNYQIWNPNNLDKSGQSSSNQMGQFPVIFFTLKGITHSTWEDSYDKFKIIIANEYTKCQFLLEATTLEQKPLLSENEKKQFQSILHREGSKGLFETSLQSLILWLHRYYNKRVIVLIDEYDAPIHAAYLHGYYEKMVEFMRGFLGDGLKDNSLLEKGILTGILRVSKESIFSGFNNPTCYTLLEKKFEDKFGLLEEDVIALLEEHDISYQIDNIRKWYNGYLIGDCSLYNPWSIMQCIENKGELKPYWVNTSENELIKKLLWNGTDSLKQDVERLLLGESITKTIQEGLVFSDLKYQEHAVWGLFFFSGYLTLSKGSNVQKPEFSLKIPNQEVYELYKSIMQNWLREYLPGSNLSTLLQSLITGDVEVFSELFQTLIINAMSSHDLPKNTSENIYHAFVLGLLVALEKTHEVKSNRESGLGRYDVCLIPKQPTDLGIVLEFKKVKKGSTLEESVEEALLQIETKKYVTEFKSRGINQVLTLGIAFQGKQILVKEGPST